MNPATPLAPEQLWRRCDPETLGFADTRELEELPGGLGQQRAEEAMRFGLRLVQPGYNVFVLGEPGTGRHATVWRVLQALAADGPVPPDLCYVHNFGEPRHPKLLRLPAGVGGRLRGAMQAFVKALEQTLSAALAAEDHVDRVNRLREGNRQQEESALKALAEGARSAGLGLMRTTDGLVVAPQQDGEAMPAEVYQALPEAERTRLEGAVRQWSESLEERVQGFPAARRTMIEALDRAVCEALKPALSQLLAGPRRQFAEQPAVCAFLDAVERDVLETRGVWLDADEDSGVSEEEDEGLDSRYLVNLLVDNGDLHGAPLVEEDNPGFGNLIGRIEHTVRMGQMVTGAGLIRAGALHRAQGGYLVLDANRLLGQPYAWEGLKRALRSRELRLEPPAEAQDWSGTVTLEPEPVPSQLKVVLIGDREAYYLLENQDPDFQDLFKIAADFEDELFRDAAGEAGYSRLVATLGRQCGLRPFDAPAVAHLIERAARLAEDSHHLSLHTRSLADLMREADLVAADDRVAIVGLPQVRQALALRRARGDRYARKLREAMLDGTLVLPTAGEACGQVNALVVVDGAGESFGHAARVSAAAWAGEGDMVDIERETDLGGSIHSKGVMILSAFLASRYGRRRKLSLSASLTFEQSYHPVEGDSASLAELCALLSAIGQVPIRQCLAVTGAINQLGEVQAIGGVNEKIEGFFDLCEARGLAPGQGVVVPHANVRHLMLASRVLEAVREGRFQVHAVGHVDEAIALLTGLPSGRGDPRGVTAPGSVEDKIVRALAVMAEAHGGGHGDGGGRDRHPL
ncbi:MAG: AAA family ATPase [Rhodocyclaceae bacterium]|nr:AAA family ATPase [Rhodocyclaceae bacterium]